MAKYAVSAPDDETMEDSETEDDPDIILPTAKSLRACSDGEESNESLTNPTGITLNYVTTMAPSRNPEPKEDKSYTRLLKDAKDWESQNSSSQEESSEIASENSNRKLNRKAGSSGIYKPTHRRTSSRLKANINRSVYITAQQARRKKNKDIHTCEKCPGETVFGWECVTCRTYHGPEIALKSKNSSDIGGYTICNGCNYTQTNDWICGCNSTRQPVNKDPLLGKDILVLWPTTGTWRAGTVQAVSLPVDEGTHDVLYENDTEAISEKLTGPELERWKLNDKQ